MENDMPTTRKELCAYINGVLMELKFEAEDNIRKISNCAVSIKGNPDFIYDYIDSMCAEYNLKNTGWHCEVENDGTDEFSLCVFSPSVDADADEDTLEWQDVDDSNDMGFEWQEDDSDEPLETETD